MSTNGDDLFFFNGMPGLLNITLVNPYSGFTVTVNEPKNINQGVYNGLGGVDTILMSSLGDALFIRGSSGNQLVSSIEVFLAGDGGDVIALADLQFTLGDTTIFGGQGDDILWANVGNDYISGAGGNDIIDGGAGNDELFGEGDNDYLAGGDGDDRLDGGDGDDVMDGGNGADTFVSGLGNDTIVSLDDGSIDVINVIAGVSYTDLSLTVSGDDLIIGVGGFGTITIAGQFLTAGSGVDELVFSDGSRFDVRSINLDPTARDDDFTGVEETDITGNLLADNGFGVDFDRNGDVVTVVAGTFNTQYNGVITISADGSFTYMPADSFHGVDTFNYLLQDGRGGFATATASFTIASVNDAPVAIDDDVIGVEDGQTFTSVLVDNGYGADTDPDGDPLSVVAGIFTTLHGGVVVLLADGNFTYTPAANYNGPDSFDYTLLDGEGGQDTATVHINVLPTNDAPVAMNDDFTGVMNTNTTGNVLLDNGYGVDTDMDGDVLGVVADTQSTINNAFVLIFATGDFIYTPAVNFVGVDSFQYTLDDGQGGQSSATVFVNVTGNPGQVIVGTEGNDTLTGGQYNDSITGLGGHDTILGGQGNDYLIGGDGDDVLYGDSSVAVYNDKSFSDDQVFPGLQEGVNIKNLRPPGDPALAVNSGNLHVDFDASATITFRNGFAGYNNTLGVYRIAADGTIQDAQILFANVKTAGLNIAHTIDLPVDDGGGEFAFFIIANGNDVNNGYSGLDITGNGNVSFVYDYGQAGERAAVSTDNGSRVSIVYNDGVTERVLSGPHYSTTERDESVAINRDNKIHNVSGLLDVNNHDVLRIGFEDLPSLGDADYEDVLFDLNINKEFVQSTHFGNDVLIGGAGNDTLYGEAGNDVLVMGLGADHVYGGIGSDQFVYDVMDSMVDKIYDFETGSGGDVLNITDILEGYDANDAVDDFVRLVNQNGNTSVQVNADGDAGGAFTTIAIFQGGISGDVNSLLQNGNLVLDQSATI
jgi:Ca2+-binding RTX toxin-like protein